MQSVFVGTLFIFSKTEIDFIDKIYFQKSKNIGNILSFIKMKKVLLEAKVFGRGSLEVEDRVWNKNGKLKNGH